MCDGVVLSAGVLYHHQFLYIINSHCELGEKSRCDLVGNSLKPSSLINLSCVCDAFVRVHVFETDV